MIKINLLPVKQKQRQYTVVYQLVIGGVVLLIGIFGCTLDHILQKAQETSRNEAKQKLQQQIAEYDRLIGEVKQYEQKSAELQRKLDVIASLNQNKVGPVHLLEELSVTIPKKVWLTSVKEVTSPPASHQVTLVGNAINDETVAEFMSKLSEDSTYFHNVNLVEARASTQNNVPIQVFTITCDMTIPPKALPGTSGAAPTTGGAPTN